MEIYAIIERSQAYYEEMVCIDHEHISFHMSKEKAEAKMDELNKELDSVTEEFMVWSANIKKKIETLPVYYIEPIQVEE